ncbi:hypothetical protein LCGC14_1467150 [marine sediment metagenome]|uniref:Uncharacterized protein n=1 Tax=marine sediment metagenome TaxID=412755 RepID=A0A0F9LU15_9ZZZZ
MYITAMKLVIFGVGLASSRNLYNGAGRRESSTGQRWYSPQA